MKPWVVEYEVFTGGDGDRFKTAPRFHETEESAQRDLCGLIIEHGIAQMDQSDEDDREIVLGFLTAVEQGNYDIAIQKYQNVIDKYGWDEKFSVTRAEPLTAADTNLMQLARDCREAWTVAEDDEDEDDGEEAADGD